MWVPLLSHIAARLVLRPETVVIEGSSYRMEDRIEA
jgi:hypothetical protein